MRTALLAVAAALAAFAPAAASACGGFFCSAQPVDQQAERILFVDHGDGTITSYVEIAYQGEPEGFAWVVPVPSVPELDTWYGRAFNGLDLATQPQFQVPWGCFAEADAGGAAGGAPPGARDDVDVLAQERVGPFDTVTIQSQDPRALVEWLRANGYRILPAMEPFVALYTAEGMKFLAMKLAPGEDTDSIEPIKMTYAGMAPAVPLRLTSVAAQLEMGVKIWILSDRRYGLVNGENLLIDDADLRFDPWTWTTNYVPLVARMVDDADGKAFVTELAGPTAELAQTVRDSFVPDRLGQEAIDARDALADVLASKPYITRLYARLSPAEMDYDPIFGAVEGGDVSNLHVVPQPEGMVDVCGPPVETYDPCDFAACGQGGTCAAVEDEARGAVPACACTEGTLARAQNDGAARAGATVACGDARLNFTDADVMGGDPALAFPDACAGDPCGAGNECVTLNGFQSCRCAPGKVAVGLLDEMGRAYASCADPIVPVPPAALNVPLREPALPYPGRVSPMPTGQPTALPRNPNMPTAGGSDSGLCSATPGRGGDLAGLALLAAGALLRRRRRA